MANEPFNEPRLALNRIYTRGGDRGLTSLVGGQRVAKDSLRIECFGTVDELNAFVGTAAIEAAKDAPTSRLAGILTRVQHELFNLGSILATLPEDVHPKQPRVTGVEVSQLESEIDEFNEPLPALRSFVLPGGSALSVGLHVCRTVCRRAERLTIALSNEESVPPEAIEYLNRLSDALFVWSRWANFVSGVPEVLWQPNRAASGQGSDT
jgi:cob(I)alamin adenosyltransferase